MLLEIKPLYAPTKHLLKLKHLKQRFVINSYCIWNNVLIDEKRNNELTDEKRKTNTK